MYGVNQLHFARVVAAISSVMDNVPVEHHGSADLLVVYTDSMLMFAHFEHWQ